MRGVRRILAAAVALPVLAMFVVVLWPDAELDPDARRWLEAKPRAPDGPNLFHGVVGLQVAAGEDPVAAGERMVRAVNAAVDEAASRPAGAPRVPVPELDEPVLALDPALRELCNAAEGPCLETWRARAAATAGLAAAHATLLERYVALREIPDYVDTLRPDFRAPLPPVLPLFEVHRLWLAGVGAAFDPARPAPAARALRADMALVRRILASADSLMAKLAAASLLAVDLHAYAELAAASEDPSAFAPIEPLGRESFDLGRCVASEFRFAHSGIGALARGHAADLRAGGDATPGWLDRLAPVVFKANRATNLTYRHFAVLAVYAGLPPAELARVYRETGFATVEPGWRDYLLDPVGSVLYAVAWADMSRHHFRLQSLRGLITLVNARLAMLRESVPADGMQAWLEANAEAYHDPYAEEAFRYDAGAGVIRFDAPVEEERFTRLRL